MKKSTRKIKKILKDLESLRDEASVKFAFSYIEFGKDLNSLDADVVHNIGADLASETLMHIIEERIFEDPFSQQSIDDVVKERETMAKLHMFNLFNKGKKFEA
tara:strand:- start:828 stop:1136 length:309 start_codon:yes stop_codon:yes gene_type:complete